MQEAQPTTEPRTYVCIADDFRYANDTVKGIMDLLQEADSESLDNGTLTAMAHRCWLETKKAERLFHDLLECYQDEHSKLKALEEELNAKPQKPKIETEAEALNHILATANHIIGETSKQVDSVENKAGEQS